MELTTPVSAYAGLLPQTYADQFAILILLSVLAVYYSKGIAWDRPDKLEYLLYEKPQLKNGGVAKTTRQTRNVSRKLQETDSTIAVFWGSQSGTAEGFANRIARDIKARYGVNCLVADLSDYDVHTIAEITSDKLSIFLLSTFGEGDPSDNATGLWHWIQTSEVSLSNLRYLAFGLGNSNYKYYNKVVDVVVEAFDARQAQCLLPVGRADDAVGATEEDFISWKETVFEYLESKLNFEAHKVVWQPKFDIAPASEGEIQHAVAVSQASGLTPIHHLPVKTSHELCAPKATKSVLHLDLDLSAFPEMTYKTGDHLLLLPSNPTAEVARLLRIMGQAENADQMITLSSVDGSKTSLPSVTTLSSLLKYHLEICAPVSRDIITQLTDFAPSTATRQVLEALASDKAAYASFQAQNHVNLGRLMELSTQGRPEVWSHLPLPFMIEALSTLKPRSYSISSSAIVSARTASLTVAVSDKVLADTSNGTISIPGVASNYLAACHNRAATQYCLDGPGNTLQGGKVSCQIRRSQFKMPALASAPIVMIATGTGLAPFRAFIQERARLAQIGKNCGKMVLFFGCQYSSQDYLYKDELAQFQQFLGDKLTIITAFSRDTDKRVYVQDRLSEHVALTAEMLVAANANLYVCGSATMAREVSKVIASTVMADKSWTEEQTNEWMSTKKKTRKYQEDVWG